MKNHQFLTLLFSDRSSIVSRAIVQDQMLRHFNHHLAKDLKLHDGHQEWLPYVIWSSFIWCILGRRDEGGGAWANASVFFLALNLAPPQLKEAESSIPESYKITTTVPLIYTTSAYYPHLATSRIASGKYELVIHKLLKICSGELTRYPQLQPYLEYVLTSGRLKD